VRTILSLFLLSGVAVLSLSAGNVNVYFDEFTSPPVTCCYSDTGVTGPLVYPDVTVQDGSGSGYVMNGSGWNNMQTSGYNLFGTESGSVRLIFNSGVSNFSVDVINGSSASDFTLDLFDAGNSLIYTSTFSLNGYGSLGSVLTVNPGISGIWLAEILGNEDFAIDTVSFDTGSTPIPEPSTILLMAGGLVAFGLRRRRA
jgi:hypothetical protein